MQKPAHHGPGAVGPHGDLRHRLSVSGPCSGVANGSSLSSRQGGLQDDRVALCWDGPLRVTAPAPLSCRPEAAHRQPSETLPFPWLRQCQGCITGLRLVAGWCDDASVATVHAERNRALRSGGASATPPTQARLSMGSLSLVVPSAAPVRPAIYRESQMPLGKEKTAGFCLTEGEVPVKKWASPFQSHYWRERRDLATRT